MKGREEGGKEREERRQLTYGPEPQQYSDAIEREHWNQLICN